MPISYELTKEEFDRFATKNMNKPGFEIVILDSYLSIKTPTKDIRSRKMTKLEEFIYNTAYDEGSSNPYC